ncbi:MAG: hypothetical protein ACP5XB_10420 [Isosphaeraceae bacterium]
MPVQVTCPSCAAELAEAEAACPACGCRDPAAAIDDLIASWMAEPPVADNPAPAAQVGACLSCGYEGPMVACPEGDRILCPACSSPWNDRGGIVREFPCPECGQTLLLTDEQFDKMIICNNCHSLLGCLLRSKRTVPAVRPAFFYFIVLALAFGLGYSVAQEIWNEHIPWVSLRGVSFVVLSITWALLALGTLTPPRTRRRRFTPPGQAACVAVSAASLLSLLYGWDQPYLSFTRSRNIVATAALRAVHPLPLAAAVLAVWLLLVLERRWKPEPSWIDRLGRLVALYWLGVGLVVSIVSLIYP